MQETTYNILTQVCAALVIIVPAYNMMPYKIRRLQAVILFLMLLMADIICYPIWGTKINLATILLVYGAMTYMAGHMVMSLCMSIISYMLAVLLNHITVASLVGSGIDVFSFNAIQSLGFQLMYSIFIFFATYVIGKKILKYREKIDNYFKIYQSKKVTIISCVYMLICFAVYEIAILISAEQGYPMHILIINIFVMSIVFGIALIIPNYAMAEMKKEIEKREKTLQKITSYYTQMIISECATINVEEFEHVRRTIIEEIREKRNSDVSEELIESLLADIYGYVYKNK